MVTDRIPAVLNDLTITCGIVYRYVGKAVRFSL